MASKDDAGLPCQGIKVWRCSAVRDLAPPGELTSPQTHPFEFANAELQYDSYRGLQVRLRCGRPFCTMLQALYDSPRITQTADYATQDTRGVTVLAADLQDSADAAATDPREGHHPA